MERFVPAVKYRSEHFVLFLNIPFNPSNSRTLSKKNSQLYLLRNLLPPT